MEKKPSLVAPPKGNGKFQGEFGDSGDAPSPTWLHPVWGLHRFDLEITGESWA